MQYPDVQITYWTTIHRRHVMEKLRWMAHRSKDTAEIQQTINWRGCSTATLHIYTAYVGKWKYVKRLSIYFCWLTLTTFYFLLYWANIKIKRMENFISKISKDRLLSLQRVYEKSNFHWKRKGKAWPWQAYRGNIYEDPFHKEIFKNAGSITNWGVVEVPFLKTG